MRDNEFRMLSLKEEKNLESNELKEYYASLRSYVMNRKLKVTTKGATTIAPKIKKGVNIIAKKLIPILAGGSVEIITDGKENIPSGTVLFASTHQGLLDNFCWIPENPKHSILLHSKVASRALIVAQLCTGLVLVSKEKDDVENRKNAKLDMIQLLMSGHSVWYYPESAWNLSPNKLHLPMSFGFLDVAQKADVPVIPVAIEYTYDTSMTKERITKIHLRYGKRIMIKSNDDLNRKLLEYEEIISTMRWELIEEKGTFKRKEISNWDYINYLKGNIANLEFGKISVDIERRCLWSAKDDFFVFNHINDVPFDKYGHLLETEEVRKLRRINSKKLYSVKRNAGK